MFEKSTATDILQIWDPTFAVILPYLQLMLFFFLGGGVRIQFSLLRDWQAPNNYNNLKENKGLTISGILWAYHGCKTIILNLKISKFQFSFTVNFLTTFSYFLSFQ